MYRTQCVPHNCTALALCFAKECPNRLICQEHSCFREHAHGSYRTEVVMLDLIREKRDRAKQILDSVMQNMDEALGRCRKNIQLGLSSFLNESQRVREFDLNNVTQQEIADFMEANFSGDQFQIDLKRLLDKISNQTNSFKDECFQKYKEDKSKKPEPIQSELNKKKKKKGAREQLPALEPSREYVVVVPFASAPEGLRAISRCISEITPEKDSIGTSQKLSELLRHTRLEIQKELYTGSKQRHELEPMLRFLLQESPKVMLISCETIAEVPSRHLFGMYLHSHIKKDDILGSVADFMFKVEPDRSEVLKCQFTEEQVRTHGTVEILKNPTNPTYFSLSLGFGEFVIPNHYTRYRSYMYNTGMFCLPERMALQVKEIQLFLVSTIVIGEAEGIPIIVDPKQSLPPPISGSAALDDHFAQANIYRPNSFPADDLNMTGWDATEERTETGQPAQQEKE